MLSYNIGANLMGFKGVIILQLILMGCTTIPCPKKYMRDVNIRTYCELDYGAKWKLRKD
tara:strand:+ start:1148 stop:1324 length:177 start_codon:yes stop_codon:yes gene_type:complete